MAQTYKNTFVVKLHKTELHYGADIREYIFTATDSGGVPLCLHSLGHITKATQATRYTTEIVMVTSLVLVLLVINAVVSCDCGVFKYVINSLRDLLHIREIALIYSENPFMEGVSCQAVAVHRLASAAGVRMSFLNLDRGADLVDFFLGSTSMVTALLALPDNQARSVMGQVLETGFRNWIQLLIASPNPEEFLQGMYLPMDSRALFLHRHAETLVVKEAYHVHKFGPLLVRQLRLPQMSYLVGFWARRSDKHGLTLKAGISNQSADAISNSPYSVDVEGLFYDLWNAIETKLNISTQFCESPEREIGMMTGNGSWTGIIGMLQRNETDVAIYGVTITGKRSLVADFTYVFWKTSFYAYIRWPTTSYVTDMRRFAAVMLATVVGATLARFMTLWLLPERGVTKSSVVFDVSCAFCQQGIAGTQWFRRSSGCVVLMVTELAGFLVFSIYSATLMSRLAVQTRTHSYEAFADLVNSTPYVVGLLRGGSSIEMIKPQLQKLNLHRYQLEDNLEYINERICEGNYIFVRDGPNFRKELTSCSADIASVAVGSSSLSFAVRKKSPYLGAINYQLMKMMEKGDVARLRKKWISAESTAPQETESITMLHIAPCIVSLTLGIATSAVCLLAEWRVDKRTSGVAGTRVVCAPSV